MKVLGFFLFLLFISNCSLNNESKYWTEDNDIKVEKEKKLIEINKKSNDITLMSLKEYEIFIEDYTKKSKYPNVTQ